MPFINRTSVILVVDDEPTVLASVSKVLTPHYRVLALNKGTRVIKTAKATPQPDLILLDVLMPDIDGYKLIEQLKAEPKTREIPVIFVTGDESLSGEEKGLKLGAVDYITKPISPVTLLARVKNHLLIKHARDFLTDKNTYLEEEIAKRMAESVASQDICIRALAHLAETRDNETGAHILRTQNYVEVLARYLHKNPKFKAQLTEEKINLITKSAPLHDIGKVGVPDYILMKPGKPTPEERSIMETHTLLGLRAIEQAESDVPHQVAFLKTSKEIVRWHHERWDGTGYPDGLAGESIPLSARLMAIADVFDALVSRRVYKNAMPISESRDIVIAGKGTQFDPDIVDAFSANYEAFVDIAKKFGVVEEELRS